MDRKERIFEYISSKEYIPLNFDELATVLDVPKEDTEEFSKILDELCFDGKIYLTKKNKYMSVGVGNSMISGKIRCVSKGFFAFLTPDDENEEDIFLYGDKLNGAIHGDRVLASIDEAPQGGRREGSVIRVLERGNEFLVGVIIKEKRDFYIVKPDNTKIYNVVLVKENDINGAKIGDRVCVDINSYKENSDIFGSVSIILGEAESLKGHIEGIILEHNIKQDFDDETLREASRVPESVSQDDIKDRVDLRDKLTFTVDGDTARDFDDAISLEMLDNGNYELGVHIADVTHYVTEGTALDNEALERGTSVYLSDRVIPMLPEKLSNGICSLNPKVDRLTLSATMEIDKSGNVLSHRLEKTVINSKERMTYNKVSAILEGDEDLRNEYKHLVPTIEKMAELALILQKKRDKRGAIQFDFPETGILCNEFGKPVDIVRLDRGVSNKIIEEFMLVANETVAEYAYWSELPFVYRTHEAPTMEKITNFNDFIKPFGKAIKGKFDEENPIHPKELQKILEEFQGTPEERTVSMTMLRSLMKAEYRTENLGHFGLAARYYCHFTSPIRRYPDLTIHRILKSFITGNMNEEKRRNFESFAALSAKHSSETEIEAEYAERDVDDLMKAEYMKQHIGETFAGVITHITNFGMFVELENSVEGLVRAENMADDYYNYSREDFAMIGERTNKVYKIGDEVSVTVVRTDVVTKQIDFVLADNVTSDIIRKIQGSDKNKVSAKELIERKKKSKEKATQRKKKFIKRKGR